MRRLFLRSFGIIAVVVAVWSLFLGVPSGSEVSAHNLLCNDGQPFRWSGTTATHWWSSAWDVSYRNALSNGTTNFNTSDFSWIWEADPAVADIIWADFNNPDTSIAGAAALTIDCTSHTILYGTLYFNFPHFNASFHTQDEKQCSSIHEQGHGVGLDHNNLVSILNPLHSARCHDTPVVKELEAHDTGDINAKY